MAPLRVGFIGTGKPWKATGATGFGMAYAHAEGYAKLKGVAMVACADLVADNAAAFASKTGAKRIYTDYREMLRRERLDMVSVATWPHLHAPMVIDAAKAGVRAIHCEKPMARTFDDAVRMTEVCRKHRVRLTFNHQRRFGAPYRLMRDLVWNREIGKLIKLEAYPPNLYDWGTHWVDMLQMFNRETPASWVVGGLDSRSARRVFGAPCEDLGVWHVKYANGVHALVVTGGDRIDSCALRAVGTLGTVEVHWDAPLVRLWVKGMRAMKAVPVADEMHGGINIDRAIASAVRALKTGGRSELCAENALRATEIIFGGYESARRRARVDLPLTLKGNPLDDMIARGEIRTAKPKR